MKHNLPLLAILGVAGLCGQLIAQQGDNTALSLAWHEASDAVFARGYVLTAGIDIDQDGKGEILTYDGDGGQRIVYLFEASADNTYDVVWSYQFSDGTTGIVGGERGIMVTDLDNDGFGEITVIMDSVDPNSTDGFDAGHIFEWDGTDNGLPSTPTATFDPPRDAVGQVRLEYNTQALDLDGDGKTEILMTHRGGNGTFLSIIQVTSTDLAANGVTVTVEFEDTFLVSDLVHYQMRNTGFGITDIDFDGLSEIIMFDDNTGLVRVFEVTGADTYAFVAEWQPAPTGWVAGATVKSRVLALDLDLDGVLELYLADTRGNTWIVTSNGNVSTMFDDANWTLLHDWKVGNVYNEGGELRGCLLGDVDQDNKPDIYFAGNNFGSIMDMEYDGGDVTNGDNYSYYLTAVDANDAVDGGHFARPANMALSDMDGDGALEVVVIVPWTGANPVENLTGLYVFEQDLTAPGPPAAPTNLSASPFSRRVALTWSANSESDLAKYRIFRDISSPATTLIDSIVGSPANPSFNNINLINGTTYYYRITAVDSAGNKSDYSTEVDATPFNSPPVAVDDAINIQENMPVIIDVLANDSDVDGDILSVLSVTQGSNGAVAIAAGDTTVTYMPNQGYNGFDSFTYQVSDGAGGLGTATVNVTVGTAAPHITGIIDVPDDQGRQVYVSWDRSYVDLDEEITQYGIKLQNPEGTWVSLGTVTAEQAETYTYLADTFGDSTATGTVWSRFQVTAYGDPGDDYYPSPVDSGYSIDNLAPAVPTGLVASVTEGPAVSLAWNGPVDYDFDFFRVYRQPSVDTVATAIAETYDPAFTDTTAEGGESFHYWISALDVNGNESGNSQPVSVTVLGLEGAPGLPTEFALHPNYPNPFNPSTTISYDLPQPGPVALVVYDLRGREVARLAESQREAGYHQVTWSGRNAAGREVPTGIYIARLSTPGYTKSIKMVLLK